MVDPFGALILTGFFAVALGYVWITHLVRTRVESATDGYEERLGQLENRLDKLETAVETDD